jgi:hypothetical protein
VPEEVSTARPTQVLWAVWLSVISAIWELASDELEGRGFVSGVMSRTDTIVELVGLGTVLAVTVAIARRVVAQTSFCTASGYLLFTEPASSWYARAED